MTPRVMVNLGIALLLVALGTWLAFHAHWEYEPIRTPLQGDALSNRFYSLEHIAKSIGVRTQTVTTLRALPPNRDALYAERFTDEYGHSRAEDVKKWVTSGGRLIVPDYVLNSYPEVRKWVGLRERVDGDPPLPARKIWPNAQNDDSDCFPLDVSVRGIDAAQTLTVCTPYRAALYPVRPPQWSAAHDKIIHALRMPVGRGSVVVLPMQLLGNRELLRQDHALLFFSATGLKPGDHLALLDSAEVESFAALLWRLAAPALVFLACASLLLIARQLPRYGPLAPAPEPVRRSLAEQIRANAAFSARTGKLGALRAAVRRALDQTASASIAGYALLDVRRRVELLAGRAGVDPKTLNAAMTADAAADMKVQRSAIALLEYTRRILQQQARTPRNP